MADILPPNTDVEATAPEPQSDEEYSHYLPQEDWDKVVSIADEHATDPEEVDWREPEDLETDEAEGDSTQGLLIDTETNDEKHEDLVIDSKDDN